MLDSMRKTSGRITIVYAEGKIINGQKVVKLQRVGIFSSNNLLEDMHKHKKNVEDLLGR